MYWSCRTTVEHETIQQNISKYFRTGTPETSSVSKQKSVDEGGTNEAENSSRKNVKYDREKRKRTYLVTWTERFPWARSAVAPE